MKIVTVNLPVSYLDAVKSLIGPDGLYPSRSELIRVAVRDFLIRELESAYSFKQYYEKKIAHVQKTKAQVKRDSNYIKIEDKIYKIIQK